MIMAHAGYPEGLGTTVQETLEMLQNATGCNHRLILEIDDVPVGEMNFRILAGHCAEIGIKICNFNHHNQGFRSAFLTMLISSLFKQMEIQNPKLMLIWQTSACLPGQCRPPEAGFPR